MAYIARPAVPRPAMLEAIRRIRAQGLRVAALTNNWVTARCGRARRSCANSSTSSSSRALVGLRKPDPRIYQLTCRQLGVEPAQAAFLDDIGRNLKSARALGMTTIKVEDPRVGLARAERRARLRSGRLSGAGLLLHTRAGGAGPHPPGLCPQGAGSALRALGQDRRVPVGRLAPDGRAGPPRPPRAGRLRRGGGRSRHHRDRRRGDCAR